MFLSFEKTGQPNREIMTSDDLNDWKARHDESEAFQKKILRAVLDKCDRELLIEILKKRGIIRKDWHSGLHVMVDNPAAGFPTLKEVDDYNKGKEDQK